MWKVFLLLKLLIFSSENNKDWAEKVVNVEVEIPHRQPAATISMTSTLDEDFDNESWGIRDFYLFIA